MRSRKRVDDRDGVRARLLADREHDRGLPSMLAAGLGLLLAVFDVRDVAHEDRVAVDVADDDVAQRLGAADAAAARGT